jgi:4-hydroxy-2-oxoheptanedioate aldolase
MFSAHTFGIQDGDYPGDADANLLVIVQIESREGIENVQEIAYVEGVDVLFVGESKCPAMNPVLYLIRNEAPSICANL